VGRDSKQLIHFDFFLDTYFTYLLYLITYVTYSLYLFIYFTYLLTYLLACLLTLLTYSMEQNRS